MTFLLLILASIGFVTLLVGGVLATMVMPYSNVASGAGKLGVIVVCIGGTLFAIASAGLVLFVIALGMSNM